MKLLDRQSMSGWARRLRLFQGAGQLEHIIAQHVEVGLGARHAPGEGGQDGDLCPSFPCEELRNLLVQLHLGDDDTNVVTPNGFDERL